MNLKSIEYFLIIAEEMNITRAAERLNLSQQALSSHLKRLEEEYGVILLERKPSLHLTAAGEALLFHGRQLLENERNMRAAFSDISRNARATLRVGISRLRGDVFFPLIWELYHTSHPNISIDLLDGNSNSFSDLLSVGKVDLYIGVDIPETSGQDRILLSEERIQCGFTDALLKEYYPDSWDTLLCSFQNGVSLDRISALPFVALRENNRVRKTVDQSLPHTLKLRYILQCNQQELVYQMAREGIGAGLLSPVTLYLHHRDSSYTRPDFHVFPLCNTTPTNRCFLVYRKDYRLPGYIQDFIQDTHMVFQSYSRSIQKKFKT